MIKVKVEVLPMNVDEVARAEVRVQDQDGAPWGLESGGNSNRTFDLEDGQELVVSGRTIGRMVLNRDQRATQVQYHEDERPPQQSAYDPEKDPAEQKRREEEKARAEGRRSPSAYVPPGDKPMEGPRPSGEPRFVPIDQPQTSPPPADTGGVAQESETAAAARRIREEQQRAGTTDGNRAAGPTLAPVTESKQATVPAQPASPASRPTGAEEKVGSTEPVAASAPGGAVSSKDVKGDAGTGKT